MVQKLVLIVGSWFSAIAVAATISAAEPKFTAAQFEFFEKQVQPILAAKCVKCHGGEAKVASEFYLTSRAAVLRGGELGPAVDLEKPEASQLLTAIRYESLEMPPSGKLPSAEIDVLTRWVKEGLPWPPHLEKEPAHVVEKKKQITDEDRKFWAYQPVVEPQVPKVRNQAWVRTPIDAFILAKLEANNIAPAAEADPRELIRRATYDLTGLPPTPEEVAEFVSQFSEKAYERLIDRLLASPHYGEKWGRHWLDLVRYAETHGYERDSAKPFAWRYRDYVVESLNADKPYDVFLREQLAGDELPNPTPAQLAATGYYRLGIWDDEPADRELARYDELDGITATTGGVVLGMSVGCARCHDHKRDPILQRDYYKLLAFFSDLVLMNRDNLQRVATDEERKDYERRVAEKRRREADAYSEIYQIEQKFLASAEGRGIRIGNVRGTDLEDLRFRLYRDTWNEMPDFDALKAETVGEVASRRISLEPASRSEAIGLVFEGKLLVPTTGEYEFRTTAREAVRVIVDGRTVIDRPKRGLHHATGTAKLAAGPTSFRLEYFNAAQAPKLQLSWSGPGFKDRSLSDEVEPGKRKTADTWAYATRTPDKKNWMQPDFDDSMWTRGEAGFGTKGTPGADIGTVWNSKNIYLRRKFTLAEVPDRLVLDLHHDEDVTIFLNGQKVYSAEGFLRDYQRVTLDDRASAVLKAGENVIAVHCTQSGGGQYVDVRIAGAPTTLEEFVRLHGDTVIGKAESDRYAKLVDDLNASRNEKIPEPGIDVMSVRESGRRPTHILLRGLPQAKGEEVTAGVPEVLKSTSCALPNFTATEKTSGKRTALAAWLTDANNSATARVMANRLWQYHFGRGLVATSNDFGKLGELPTHPELLDWLATEVVRGEWRLKRMHRMMMSSSVYRQSGRAPSSALTTDPDNRLWGRFASRRLTAEEVRDSMLAVGGGLDLRVGGPSVYPPIPKEVLAGQSRPGEGWPTSQSPADANRRSIYVHVKRALQLPIMSAHDQADTDSSCAVRYVTTVPTQALGLMNGEFAGEQAAALSARLRRDVGDGDVPRVRRALELTLQRSPSDDEVRRDVDFVRSLKVDEKLSDEAAWDAYCLMCLNANEFFYLD